MIAHVPSPIAHGSGAEKHRAEEERSLQTFGPYLIPLKGKNVEYG